MSTQGADCVQDELIAEAIADGHVTVERPRLLDLFCGAGGAGMGYHRAGFEVVGVDIKPQPDYPFEFHQADAMDYPLDGFDVIHASPPCQDHSVTRHQYEPLGTAWVLDATIRRLKDSGRTWVVENVAGPTVEMAGWWFTLCGTMFGLNLRRHRRFGSSALFLAPACDHDSFPLAISGVGHNEQGHVYRKYAERGLKPPGFAERRAIMEVPWITNREAMAQVVPPAYSEWIGRQLVTQFDGRDDA